MKEPKNKIMLMDDLIKKFEELKSRGLV